MKRLLAIPAVLAALAVSSVATVPASAASISHDGYEVSVTCAVVNGAAEYTVTVVTPKGSTTKTFPLGTKCLIS
jgi:hypothetical protein